MSISMDGIGSSLYNTYLNNMSGITDSKVENLENSLNNTDYSKMNEEELLGACKEFESYLVEQMFKSMEKMVPKSDEEDKGMSTTLDYFGDILTQQYAKNAVDQGSFGIAEALYEQMKRNYNIKDAKESN